MVIGDSAIKDGQAIHETKCKHIGNAERDVGYFFFVGDGRVILAQEHHSGYQENGKHEKRSNHIRQFTNDPVNMGLSRTDQQGLNNEECHPGHHHGAMKMLNKPETGKTWEEDDIGFVKAPGYESEN